MKLGGRSTLLAAVPLGMTVFCWLTMRTDASLGSETGASYGFPLPWYAPSGASSMAYTVAIGPLAVDLLIYVAAAYALLLGWPVRGRAPLSSRRGLVLVLWAAAALSIAYAAVGLMSDPRVVAWDPSPYFDGATHRSHRVQWGTGSWQ